MGLDMYLERCDRRAYGFKDLDINEVKENKPVLYEDLKPYLHKCGSEYYSWESIFEDVGYWRKANAIHKWFVDNIQDGEDDCGYYEVAPEQIEELLNICKLIKQKCVLKKGKIANGYRFENGKEVPIMEDGEYIENPDIAEELLPTQGGFFFGSTNYDQWYIENVVDTIDILTKVLETTDFDREMVVYSSSW